MRGKYFFIKSLDKIGWVCQEKNLNPATHPKTLRSDFLAVTSQNYQAKGAGNRLGKPCKIMQNHVSYRYGLAQNLVGTRSTRTGWVLAQSVLAKYWLVTGWGYCL